MRAMQASGHPQRFPLDPALVPPPLPGPCYLPNPFDTAMITAMASMHAEAEMQARIQAQMAATAASMAAAVVAEASFEQNPVARTQLFLSNALGGNKKELKPVKVRLPHRAMESESRSECSTVDTNESPNLRVAASSLIAAQAGQSGSTEKPKTSGGAADLPSIGSAGHRKGRCKPCAFIHTEGCENGVNCPFCHLCAPGEKKRRKKEIRALRKARATDAAAEGEELAQALPTSAPAA